MTREFRTMALSSLINNSTRYTSSSWTFLSTPPMLIVVHHASLSSSILMCVLQLYRHLRPLSHASYHIASRHKQVHCAVLLTCPSVACFLAVSSLLPSFLFWCSPQNQCWMTAESWPRHKNCNNHPSTSYGLHEVEVHTVSELVLLSSMRLLTQTAIPKLSPF
jgi:hypothetical protein